MLVVANLNGRLPFLIRRIGDKISSKILAQQTRVRIVPWSGGPVESVAEAHFHAKRLGYPFLIKATAGGGGHGIRLVHSASQLPLAFERARAEAFKAFGDPTVSKSALLRQLHGCDRVGWRADGAR